MECERDTAPLLANLGGPGFWIPAQAGMTVFAVVSARGDGGGVVLYSPVRDGLTGRVRNAEVQEE